MIVLRAAAESHTGYVRSNNEDLAVLAHDFVAIADGMGGHLGGEVAARTAIEELTKAFTGDPTLDGLVAAVRRANRAIWRRSRFDRRLRGMGTTLTAAALVPRKGVSERPELVLVNVGDSRAYRLEADAAGGSHLHRLTEDHSVVEEMVREGDLSPAEAAVHPHRHVLTRALGIDSDVVVDVFEVEPERGTRLLLCSDGLSDYVGEDAIARVLHEREDAAEAARELVSRALSEGGIDNVTVVVLDLVESDERAPVAEPRLVPPRPALAGNEEDRSAGDVTEAIRLPTIPAADELGETAGSAGASGVASDGGEETQQASPPALAVSSPDVLERTELATAAVPAAELFAEDEAETDEAGGDENGEPAPDDTGAGEGAAHRRRGRARSMTVRAAPPPGLTLSAREGPAALSRGMVLVPTKALRKQYRDRIVTVRVFLFLVLLVGLIGGIVAVVIWFQQSSFFVGLDGDRVSIFQGRPGGLLWFKPSLLETSSITTHQLLPNSAAEVRQGIEESSYGAAKQELGDLAKLSYELGLAPPAATTTTTTTTKAVSTTALIEPLVFPASVGAARRPVDGAARQPADQFAVVIS